MTSTTIGRVTRAKRIDSPYLHLCAGVLACAIDDARAGSHEARQWLQGDAGRVFVGFLCASDVDLDELHHMILQHANEGAVESVQMEFADLFSLKLA